MSKTELVVHIVWATWARRPLIRPDLEGRIHRAIEEKCRDLRCQMMAVGGMPDHVHLLARLHPTVTVARLAGEVKGFSSHVVTHAVAVGRFFRWHETYFAATVSPDEAAQVASYIDNQRQHHESCT